MSEHGVESTIQREIAIAWRRGRPRGEVQVSGGRLLSLSLLTGGGSAGEGRFSSATEEPFRLKLSLEGVSSRYTTNPTIVSVITEKNPFSFLLRDVDRRFPICIPEYGVVVTVVDDEQSVAEIEATAAKGGGRTRLQQIESQPEESFEAATPQVRRMKCHTWLGLSRNMRIFAVGEKLDWIQPRFHYFQALLPENDRKPFRYEFVMGRGWGVCDKIERRLDEQVLPILRGKVVDGDVVYNLTAFATLEVGSLTAQTLRGTDFILADGYAKQHMFTPAQQERFDSLLPAEMESGEE